MSLDAYLVLTVWTVVEVGKWIGMRRAGAQLDLHRYQRPSA